MNRSFAAMSFLGIMLLAVPGQTELSLGKERPSDKHMAAFRKCAEECNRCQVECDACAAHCAHLLAQGKKEHLTTLRTCQDCATFCSAAACIVARHGPFSDSICKSCAEACARCGKECDKHSDDAEMKRCAQVCRQCEQACREMLTHVNAKATTAPRD